MLTLNLFLLHTFYNSNFGRDVADFVGYRMSELFGLVLILLALIFSPTLLNGMAIYFISERLHLSTESEMLMHNWLRLTLIDLVAAYRLIGSKILSDK